MTRLLVISSAPMEVSSEGIRLDTKFLEGMRLYCDRWDGDVHCLLQNRGELPFSTRIDANEEPFTIITDESVSVFQPDFVDRYDVILCCGDSHRYFDLAKICKKARTSLVYTIENILSTRIQFLKLDPSLSHLKRGKAIVWNAMQERRRRTAFGMADGLQANGFPALGAYRSVNANILQYLDNRIGNADLADADHMKRRMIHLERGAPLRIVHSGRLEPIKGSQDLVAVASRLRGRQIDFRLDIFGTGSLEEDIRTATRAAGLEDRIHFHGPVDFQTELVPFIKSHSDLFLSCHRQSDPSCTYIESFGCGIPVAGYANRMWQALQERSNGGWIAPLGDPVALADVIADAASDRAEIAARAQNALAFAREHSFEREFDRRLAHLKATVSRRPDRAA